MVLAPVVRGRKGEYGKLLRGAARGRLRAREDRRAGAHARGIDRAGQALQARHLGGGRPPGDAPRPAQAAGRLDRDGGRAGRRARGDRDSGLARARGSRERGRSDGRGEASATRERREGAARRLRADRPGVAPEPGPCSRSQSASRAPSTGRRWWSSSRGSSRSTLPTARASAARGWARRWRSTRSWSSPTRRCRSPRVRSRRGPNSASNYYEQMTEAIAERYGVDLDTPWEELSEEQRELFLYGTGGEPVQVTYRNRFGRRRSYATRFEGIVKDLQRRYRETDSEWTREKIEEYMSLRACPVCGGARLRAESRAVLVGGHADRGLLRAVGAPGAGVAGGGRAVGDRPARRAADPAGDLRAAAVPRERRASATCRWTARRRRCREARRSASAWRPRSAPRSSACCTSSTSPRSGCTSATTRS